MQIPVDLSKIKEAIEYVKLQSGCDYNNSYALNEAYNYLDECIAYYEQGKTEFPKPTSCG